MADLYLGGFNRGPSRELMPAKRRRGRGVQVWVRDTAGERMIAHVSEQKEAVAFAFRVWAMRGTDRLEVTVRRARTKLHIVVASDLTTPRPVPARELGDERDAPCVCAGHAKVLPTQADWCYPATMNIETPAKAKRRMVARHLNVRISPAIRDALLAIAAQHKLETGEKVTGSQIVEKLVTSLTSTP
jgi:hypothetical protein